MSKVSALVSAYYAEPYMHLRILNLKGQKPIPEIVVVARKGSVEEKIALSYDTKVISTNNVPTIGKAWNIAIQNATGDYFTTANTDDAYEVGGLARMVKVLDDNPDVGLVFADVYLKQGNKIREWVRYQGDEGVVEDMREQLQTRCFIGSMPLWRRSAMPKKFDERLVVASDYDMWFSMAKAGVKFYYIPESLGYYEYRHDSLEHRNSAILPLEVKRVRA